MKRFREWLSDRIRERFMTTAEIAAENERRWLAWRDRAFISVGMWQQ